MTYELAVFKGQYSCDMGPWLSYLIRNIFKKKFIKPNPHVMDKNEYEKLPD